MKEKPNYHQDLIENLKDPDYAVEYLKAALEENDEPQVFLLALRNVAESRGISRVAKEADLNRENIYRMLSGKGNPELKSLQAVLMYLEL